MARFSAFASDDSDSESDSASTSKAQQNTNGVQPNLPLVRQGVKKTIGVLGRVDESDSEDEEDDDEDEGQIEDEEETDEEESDESSVMDEDELTSPRRQLAVVSRSSNVQSTAARPNPIIPWAQQLGVDAQKVHVMQTSFFRMPEAAAAMKEQEQAALRPAPLASVQKGRLFARTHTLNRKHSRESEGDVRGDHRERASFAYDIDPPVYRPSRKYSRIHLESASSTAHGNEGAFVDAGLSFGRSFRAGWGPGGVLVHLGSVARPGGDSKSIAPGNSSTVSITTVPIPSQPKEVPSSEEPSQSNLDPLLSPLLQHHLTNTPIAPDADGVPAAIPSRNITFASFLPLLSQTASAAASSSRPTPPSTLSHALRSPVAHTTHVFRLGAALFDPLDHDKQLAPSFPLPVRSRIERLARKTRLSEWLENALPPIPPASPPSAGETPVLSTVFALLASHRPVQACTAALDGGYPRLATLLAQASAGDAEFQADMRAQIEVWAAEGVDGLVDGIGNAKSRGGDGGVRRVYALLAGMTEVVKGSAPGDANRRPGAGLNVGGSDVDVFAGLDWLRALGVHLWYAQPMDAAVQDVFRAYERQVLEEPERVAAPVSPVYSSTSTPVSARARTNPEHQDALFSLIRLHADPACSLSRVLHPRTFAFPVPSLPSATPPSSILPENAAGLDWSLSWHLYIILSRCMRVRDMADRSNPRVRRSSRRHQEEEDVDEEDAEPEVEGHSPSADLLTSSYAWQLERLGMLQEAIFVLLHIEGSVGREKAVKEMLARNGSQLDEWMTRGIVGSLKIPMTWVNEAKALYALDQDDVYSAYELYLSAGMYNTAHVLAVRELAPDAVVRRDLELLRSLFETIEERAAGGVEGWHARGKMFLDYARIMTRLPKLQAHLIEDAVPDAAEAEEAEELTRRIPRLLGMLPDALGERSAGGSDVRHKAALAEMVQGLVRVSRAGQTQTQQDLPLTMADEAVRLRHVQSTAYERFSRMIVAS